MEVTASPKFQLQLVRLPEDRSVNCVALPKHTVTALKSAVGKGATVMVAAAEFATGHTPLFTTARYIVAVVRLL